MHNRSLILATLFHQGPMSRADLARGSGLTAPTISALVSDLEADGLVADTEDVHGSGARRRGKPSMLVEIQDDAVSLVVVDLHAGDFRGAVMNLRGRVVARRHVDIGDATGDQALAHLVELVESLIERAPARILGVGVSTPGIVDDEGVIRQAGSLGWYDLPLAHRLAERFGVPAYVGNDVNLLALAAMNLGKTQARNLMVIANEFGVGAGLIVGGRLVEGEQFSAGEMGHLTVDGEGELCAVCGRRGCLDLFVAAAELQGRLAAAPPERHTEILSDAGRALGTVLAPIASALNLNEFLIIGPVDLVDGAFLDSAQETARARTLSPISASLTVRSLAAGPDLALLGAACQILTAELGVF